MKVTLVLVSMCVLATSAFAQQATTEFTSSVLWKGLRDYEIGRSSVLMPGQAREANYARAYVHGLADAASAQGLACMPDDLPIPAIASVVRHYLESHPEELSQPPGPAAIKAMSRQWPCAPGPTHMMDASATPIDLSGSGPSVP